MRVARTQEAPNNGYVRNPRPNTILAVNAGGQAEAEFEFPNDSPDVAGFHLELTGLPKDWATGIDKEFEVYVAAESSGSLRLTLIPPLSADPNDYAFSLRVVSDGSTVTGPTPLTLRVEPAPEGAEELIPEEVVDEAPPPPVPVQAPVEEPPARVQTPVAEQPPAPRPKASAPKAVAEERPASRPTPPPVEPVALVEEPPPDKQPAQPEPAPQAAVKPQTQAPARTAPPPSPAPAPAIRETRPEPPKQAAPARKEPAQPPVRPVRQPAAPPPVEDEPVIVDYSTGTSAHHDEVEDQTLKIDEPSILNPRDETAIALRPGETRLVRFGFTNEALRECTYILDYDNSLPEGWMTLVQDQVNLTRNASGELGMRLTPPSNAEPGDYPFLVNTGQLGGTLSPCSLILSVQATPAVRLAAKESTVKIGPFLSASSAADFQLTVENAGNADTAFRLAVRAPISETDGAGGAPNSANIYETQQWRYLFDKEMDNARLPVIGAKPNPVKIRLRLARRNPWWFGFRESHQVKVACVPVTDAENGKKGGNTVEVTAVRWRLLPFPSLLLIPIFLLVFMFLTGGAEELTVKNAQYSDAGAYWIVEPKNADKKPVDLTWTAHPLAMLRLTGGPIGQKNSGSPPLNKVISGGGAYEDSVAVSTDNRDVEYHYQVSRLIGGGDRDVDAHFIYTREDTPLEVTDTTNPSGSRFATGDSITVTVPATGYARLNLTNRATQYNRLDWWLVKPLDSSSPFAFTYNKGHGSLEPNQTENFVIKRNTDSDSSDTETKIVFVTTNSNRPVLTVTLKLAGSGGGE